MPDGHLTIDISFTTDVDITSAYLRWFGASAGAVIQGGSGDDYAYMVILPHDFGAAAEAETMLLTNEGNTQEEEPASTADEFYIYAQAENQGAGMKLEEGYPGADGTDLFSAGTPLTINKGLNKYTLTVTPEDGTSPSKEYYVKVIKLPNLTLSAFKVENSNASFERELDTLNKTQNVYVSHSNVTVVAELNDKSGGPTVNISPSGSISPASAVTPITVTVTVSEPLSEVDTVYTQDIYTLNLYYGAGEPLAAGGIISFTPGQAAGTYDEIHVFRESGTLAFYSAPTGESPITAWVLAVGGGGGGSAGHREGNGGGAGGVAEHKAYPLTAGSFTVVVGTGGAAVTANQYYFYFGNNGGDSSFGTDSAAFTAYGGGGGGANYYGKGHGRDGGSSGGSGDGIAATATQGIAPAGGNTYGNQGAAALRGGENGDPNSNIQGGGGAGGAGVGANGGPGITRSITGTDVIYAAGGGVNSPESNGAPGSGNGGRQAGRKTGDTVTSFAGGSGIVIVRFPHTSGSGN